MYIAIKQNDLVKLDNTISMDAPENTLDIINQISYSVKGSIYFKTETIDYNLAVKSKFEMYDRNNHINKFIDMEFKIDEIDELIEENIHINQKRLDLNAKIWENIVVEVFSMSSEYQGDVTDGKGWTLKHEDEDQEIDERLKPLLNLLNTNEEV